MKTQTSICLLLFSLVLTSCGGDKLQASTDQLATDMSQRIETIMGAGKKNDIILRFNQPKTVACLNAQFRVNDDIPAELKQGLFAQAGSYPARLRFANASEMDDSKKDIRGLSIKLSGIAGPSLWGDQGTQDFILNSYPALFVPTPEDFLSFIRARQEDKKKRFFLNPFDSHIRSLRIVLKARQKNNSPLDMRFWSTVPFQLGLFGMRAVKYSAIPCSNYQTKEPVDPGENQLRSAIKTHLQKQPVCFHFAVQQRTDPQNMPIEDASVIWDEAVSAFQTVATITIENQPFDSPQALAECERISFNPWQSLAEHKPLGRMNAVRRMVYEHAEKFRNKENH